MSRRGLDDWPGWPLEPVRIFEALERHAVAYVVIGGIAAMAHGSPLPTYDLDITPAPGRANRRRLLAALAELGGRALADAAGATEDVSFETPFGYLDVIDRPAGTRGYGELARDAERLELAPGLEVAVASVRDLVRTKEALGRERDLAQLPALHALLELAGRRER